LRGTQDRRRKKIEQKGKEKKQRAEKGKSRNAITQPAQAKRIFLTRTSGSETGKESGTEEGPSMVGTPRTL